MFNMDGAGADGNATPRFAAYGATKRSLQQVRACGCSREDRDVPRHSLAGMRSTTHGGSAPQVVHENPAAAL